MSFDPVISFPPQGLSPRTVLLNCVPSISRELVGNGKFWDPTHTNWMGNFEDGPVFGLNSLSRWFAKVGKALCKRNPCTGVSGEVDENAQGCTAHKRKVLEAMSDGGEWMNCIYSRSEVFYSSETEWISYNTKDKWQEKHFFFFWGGETISRRMHVVFFTLFFKKFRNVQSSIAIC